MDPLSILNGSLPVGSTGLGQHKQMAPSEVKGGGEPLVPPKPAAEQKDLIQETKKISESLNQIMEQFGRSIRFEVKQDLDLVVAHVVDRQSGEVVKSYPPEEMVDLMQRINDAIGLFLDEAA